MKKAALILASLALSAGVLFLLAVLPNSNDHFVFAAPSAPSTDVSGHITQDTTWDLTGSPYIVTGDVTVDAGFTLTIKPGVQVRFNGNFGIIILGRLSAEGGETQPILFTSNQHVPAAGDWGMLDFRLGSQLNHLRYTIIEYGGNASRVGAQIVTNTSSLIIEHSILRYSSTRGIRLYQSSATISNNTFDQILNEAIRLDTCDLAIGECHASIM
jgi:hypothetical protein